MIGETILQNHWRSILVAVTAVAIISVLLGVLLTMPPRSIAMATGPEGGTYYELGRRYQAILSREGVELRLVPTAGSVENLAALLNPQSEVSVALMQGGITDTSAAPETTPWRCRQVAQD